MVLRPLGVARNWLALSGLSRSHSIWTQLTGSVVRGTSLQNWPVPLFLSTSGSLGSMGSVRLVSGEWYGSKTWPGYGGWGQSAIALAGSVLLSTSMHWLLPPGPVMVKGSPGLMGGGPGSSFMPPSGLGVVLSLQAASTLLGGTGSRYLPSAVLRPKAVL